LSRAILQPRSGSAIKVRIPKAHLPPVRAAELPKTPSRLVFDARRPPTMSSQDQAQHDAFLEAAEKGGVVLQGPGLKLTTARVGAARPKWLSATSGKPRYFELRRHVLDYWKSEGAASDRTPASTMFLDFSTSIRRIPDKVRLLRAPGGFGAGLTPGAAGVGIGHGAAHGGAAV
jgi:hypothetical protein